MRILAISDIHDDFDRFAPETLPDADLCVVAGDLTNYGIRRPLQLAAALRWIMQMGQQIPTLWIPGNHDIGVTSNTFSYQDDVTCILNETVSVNGLTFRGVSLSPCYTLPELAEMWDYMTVDEDAERAAYAFERVDIVVSHTPPYGILDSGAWVPGRGQENYGSQALADYIARHAPRLVICGHVHEGRGHARVGATDVYNVAQSAQLIEI
jgi:Icc-related predicted phosphoesterase